MGRGCLYQSFRSCYVLVSVAAAAGATVPAVRKACRIDEPIHRAPPSEQARHRLELRVFFFFFFFLEIKGASRRSDTYNTWKFITTEFDLRSVKDFQHGE